ncbi:toll/interleukin-1 receptor domain-containing protein [Edaphobacter sp. DSM 109919]|uniref:Toll/interleukin-1 receptor domain-containing protein n=1 Tax=Edaphobacter paludis TaxID=3035702 RepID=A0AAU7CX55_9BACT
MGGILRSIFVNYRRSDSAGEAGRLFDDLTSHFSPESVFMDVAGIEPGRDFRKAIDQSVATCTVVLAVIGQEWLDMRDSHGGRRLDDASDFVRIELASALRRDIPVVPVLVRGAKMPSAEQLPDDLKELAYRNAVELTHARWKSDVHVLLQALRPYLNVGDVSATVEHREDRERELGRPVEEASGEHRTGSRSDAAALKFEPQTMERIIKELAAFIGPISEVVIKRAAKRCSSVEELYEMAAREIETEADRAKFLRSCRN